MNLPDRQEWIEVPEGELRNIPLRVISIKRTPKGQLIYELSATDHRTWSVPADALTGWRYAPLADYLGRDQAS